MLLILLYLRRRKRQQLRKSRKVWVRRIYNERDFKGEHALLVKDMMLHDHEYFFNYFRMSPTTFEKLLSWVAPLVRKQHD